MPSDRKNGRTKRLERGSAPRLLLSRPTIHFKPDTEKRGGGSVLVWRNGAILCVWGSAILLRRSADEIERRFARIVVKSSRSLAGTFLPEEGWRGREIFGLAKEESRVKGLGNGYF